MGVMLGRVGGGVKWESEREMGADVKGVCEKGKKRGGGGVKGEKGGVS